MTVIRHKMTGEPLHEVSGDTLRGATLDHLVLLAADLRGADLRGADLRESRMNRADLRHSLYDEQTLWPAGFDPLGTGAIKSERRS